MSSLVEELWQHPRHTVPLRNLRRLHCSYFKISGKPPAKASPAPNQTGEEVGLSKKKLIYRQGEEMETVILFLNPIHPLDLFYHVLTRLQHLPPMLRAFIITKPSTLSPHRLLLYYTCSSCCTKFTALNTGHGDVIICYCWKSKDQYSIWHTQNYHTSTTSWHHTDELCKL